MSFNGKNVGAELKKAFSTGVSYMMPSVVVGGIFLAIALSSGTPTDEGMVITNPFLKNLNTIGVAGFAMMIPILAGYIAYSIAGKPGLIPGMILGYIANNPIGDEGVSTGFLGAMIVGIIAGYIAKWIKGWKVPNTIKTIMPILIIPIITTFLVGMTYIYILAQPLSGFVASLVDFLSSLQGGNALLLGLVIGAFTAIDMGGPINKTVTAFTLALMAEGIFEPNGAHRIAVAIPPLGLAISTFISRKKYTQAERGMGVSAGFMGLIGITEGAIPFAVNDLKRVLPAIMIGSAVGGGIGMLQNVGTYIPHGGLIVIGAVDGKLWFFLAMLIGSVITALILHFTKPDLPETKAPVKK
ncbi:PTS fructose transporter subunit IIC [Bacillus chungangensis]|uniref:PTS system fructose-specific IIC component/fructose-specific PTS system IIC-like component n=1 Tax=Bacillus chungangensis TaxID=587633 RepID=A0ABT9WPW0_9BACI|nr:PTS fructose transporter subunit IIC [Bacillus chungangensis]MDQ0174992.1 PTS system fructose-specific IIC component/fructose-specific PTS system IIC-like component [Bacillus chungangensis]